MNILVSACLLGVNCRYSGDSQQMEEIIKLSEKHHLIPVCPEIMGGLATPREPAELQNGKVITKNGTDVTANYEKGAREVLHLAETFQCTCAILKERSPSCGCGQIYDGTFQKTLTAGNGKTAELLLEHGIHVTGESQIQNIFPDD